MMNELNRLKEWRAEEIVKIFLLKSNLNFEVVKFDNPIYDFFLKCKIQFFIITTFQII